MRADPASAFPEGLRALIGAGWHGAMLMAPTGSGPVTLVCVAPVAALAALRGAPVTIHHDGAPRPRPEILVSIAAERPGTSAVHRYGALLRPAGDRGDRRTLERLAAEEALTVALVATEPPHPVRRETRRLTAAQLALLGDARAAAAEWTTRPGGGGAHIPDDRWARAARRCPCLVRTEDGARVVAVVVPAAVVSGLSREDGHVTLSSRLVHDPHAAPEIALRVTWGEPTPVERWVRIPLAPEDAPSIRRLSRQDALLVIGAAADGRRSQTLCVRLCPDARRLLAVVAGHIA